jgi:hypothetical protein
MFADPTTVLLRVAFVPEAGLDPTMEVLGEVVGVEAAVNLALKAVYKDNDEQGTDQSYKPMHNWAIAQLKAWAKDPQWNVAVPVCYGCIVIN